MPERIHCDFCQTELDAGRHLIYEMEWADYVDNPAVRDQIERSIFPYQGEPLRICSQCQQSIQEHQQKIDEEEASSAAQRDRQWPYIRFCIVSGLVVLGIWIIVDEFQRANRPAPQQAGRRSGPAPGLDLPRSQPAWIPPEASRPGRTTAIEYRLRLRNRANQPEAQQALLTHAWAQRQSSGEIWIVPGIGRGYEAKVIPLNGEFVIECESPLSAGRRLEPWIAQLEMLGGFDLVDGAGVVMEHERLLLGW